METQSSCLTGQAIETLVDRRREFVASVRRRVQCPADAEDIVQETFLRCFEHRSHLREEPAALPWFRGIMANATVDHFRRRAALARALHALAAEPCAPGNDPQDIRGGEAGVRAAAMLEGLRPEYRQALHAIYLEARPLPEVAREAGITVNNAAVRVCRARAAARKLVGRQAHESLPEAAA